MATCPNCFSRVSYRVSQGDESYDLPIGKIVTPPTWAMDMLRGLPGVEEATYGQPLPSIAFAPSFVPAYPEFGPIPATEPVFDNT